MEKITTTIVTQLLSKLSNDRIYYTQKDLSDSGYPQFLIKRITVHLVNELRNEFNLPGEEWLNRDSDELIAEWAELQRTIKREIHLPAYLAEEIVAKSVRECIGMAIQPRKVIPDLLFEERDELDSNQLTERSSSITVNRFLVWSIVRYMEKKNRESLNISDAARVIESIESKIIEGYHPLNWLSLVKPLYELSGSTVHSDLFRRFFEHKGKNHLAKEFDLINDEINESRFVEILSSPNSIHVDGYKDDQQTLFRGGQEDIKKDIEDSDEPLEYLTENQDEKIDDLTDETPIFQTFKQEPEQEPDEWFEDEEEQETSMQEEDPEKEQFSVPVEDNEEEDEELKAPWEGEKESTYTFISPGNADDSPESGINDLFAEDPVEEEVETKEESNHSKKGESVSDAALLEIEEIEEIDDKADKVEIVDEAETKDSDSSEDLVILNLNMDSESDDEESSLINRFMFDESDDSEDSDDEETLGEMESDGDKKITTIYDELNLVRNNTEPETMDLFGSFKTSEMDEGVLSLDPGDENSELETEESEIIRKFSDLKEPDSGDDSDDSEVPMWRSFLERDEDEVKSAFQFDDKTEADQERSFAEDPKEELDEESGEELDEDGFIEEPIYDFTQKEPDLDEKIGDLSDWMKDVREKFIEDLFGDSEDAYEQALADIVEFDDWKSASKYIEKEVFTRNRIDVYDEIAVDFTDRLHSYFLDNKS